MQVAARPYFAAGIALFGASAIAISPVAPPMPDIAVPAISSAAVNLSAATDPIQAYIDLFSNTFANVQARIGDELADPAPILQQVVANQIDSAANIATALQKAGESLANSLDPSNPFGLPAQFQKAFQELLAGNVEGAVSTVWQGVLITALGLAEILPAAQQAIAQPVVNLGKVLSDTQVILAPVIGLLVPVYATVSTSASVAQDIVDAAMDGDPLGVLSTMIAAPAVIGNAVINEGLLGDSGLVSLLRNTREYVATLIAPPATETSAVTAAPQAKATTVTLNVAPQASIAAEAPAEAAPAEAAPAENAPTAEDSAAEDASTKASTPVVKDSLKAEPGKALSTKRSTPASQVRESLQGAVKNATDGLKKAVGGLSGKSAGKKSGGAASSSSGSHASSHDAA
ncbi:MULTISPECIES: hypothetical protein [Mycolicibacterium]|uniref:hypothetical protein n=1 Tax=Mycolicibacterium TaxID=1866885 RepID=UPI00069BB6B3|nr:MULTISPECIES: hypothetical protein [Mycolicibacterium]OBK05386.1 hypothetical protein A5639_18890 [Mycolicibacterium conceptionense]OMB83346.1 hypothetical protein A5746_30180 [Mycolicibacterium conceptionense]OMB85494.1 hypothetical protein A5741_18610 [Mycolicibacterium conceptionense]